MYIIVVGGGKIGYFLARQLLEDQHEVLIIEQNAEKAAQIAEDLGEIVMIGDGCEASTMERAGMGRADMAIALTGDDEDNLVVCQVAKHKFNVPHTIARINNPKNERIFKMLGIDATISSTGVILAHIEQELPSHPMIPLMTLKGGGLEIVEVKDSAGCAGGGQAGEGDPAAAEVADNAHHRPRRAGPAADAATPSIQAGDEVVAVTMLDSEDALRSALTGASPLNDTEARIR